MENTISPKYQIRLAKQVNSALWAEFQNHGDISSYIQKWYQVDEYGNWENFSIVWDGAGGIEALPTLNNVDGVTLLKIAMDLGVETPDFIPSIPTFRNVVKSDYKNASATFEKAFKQIEEHRDIAIGLANSALESIIKEIFKDDRILNKSKPGKTLYDLTCDLLKELQLFPNSTMPIEIKTIGSALISINQSIEKLRSEKTNLHGKTAEDYIIDNPLYTYYIINTVATVGLFLNSYYKTQFPPKVAIVENSTDDLPF